MNFARHQANKPRAAFTLVEIALAIAVIGFALVAIIGILPTGLTVQRENREDTIINQDGPYFLEAIRSGGEGFDHLTNYVDAIIIDYVGRTSGGQAIGGSFKYTNAVVAPPGYQTMVLTNGQRIIGLLSTPKYAVTSAGALVTNTVIAQVRALTGSAAEQTLARKDFAFSYQLLSEVTPFSFFSADSTNHQAYFNAGAPDYEWISRSNRWREANQLGAGLFDMNANIYEVRLRFAWPLLPNGNTGNRRQTFRSVVSAQLDQPGNGELFFFRPQTYQRK